MAGLLLAEAGLADQGHEDAAAAIVALEGLASSDDEDQLLAPLVPDRDYQATPVDKLTG